MKRSLDIAAIVLTALLLLGFAVLSLRGLIDPQQASGRFGAPVSDSAGALFYRVYLSRNLVIVVAGAVFLLARQWLPLAVLVTITAALPSPFDICTTQSRSRCGCSPMVSVSIATESV